MTPAACFKASDASPFVKQFENGPSGRAAPKVPGVTKGTGNYSRYRDEFVSFGIVMSER